MQDLDYYTIIGNNIKYIRKAYGLTQKDLGDIMGVSSASIQNYEYAKRLPDISSLHRLCKRYGILLETFITRTLNIDIKSEQFVNGVIYSTYEDSIIWEMLEKNNSMYNVYLDFFKSHNVIMETYNQYVANINYPIPSTKRYLYMYQTQVDGKIIFLVQMLLNFNEMPDYHESYYLFIQDNFSINSMLMVEAGDRYSSLKQLYDVVTAKVNYQSIGANINSFMDQFIKNNTRF